MVWKRSGQDRLAKSLDVLIDDIEKKFPDRDRHNDGTLGDERHRALGDKSDHNPHVHHDGLGIVTALDITHDPEHGFDAQVFADSLREHKDHRIKYVIFNGRIFSSTVAPWLWRDRNQGPGDHSEHVHISVVDDPALYDDPSPWVYDLSGAVIGPAPVFPPKLRRGDAGPAVVELQTLLGIKVDGGFGSDTDEAVRLFQRRHNLFVDGVVGSHTWGVLTAASPFKPAAVTEVALTSQTIQRIAQLAGNSPLMHVRWDGSLAPAGYIKGMAVAFALVYAKWRARDPAALLMAAADSTRDQTDALSWYASQFRAAGMDNSVAGPDTLRHLFVLMVGLGMRESGGKYNEGRDTAADNVDADTAEAGLFQMSWNARAASSELPRLFALYSKGAEGLLSIFQEGVRPRETRNFGTGEGVAFQALCKSCPAFAVETAAVGLRVLRRHWGPINRHEAEIRPEADTLFRAVQDLVDAIAVPVTPQEVPTSPEVPVPPRPPVPTEPALQQPSTPQQPPAPQQPSAPAPQPGPIALDPTHLLMLMIAALLKEKPMQDASGAQGQADPLRLALALLLRSVLAGSGGALAGLADARAAGQPGTPTGQAAPTDPVALLMSQLFQAVLPGLVPAAPIAAPPTGAAAAPAAVVPPTPIATPATTPLDPSLLKPLGDFLSSLSANGAAGGLSSEQIQKVMGALSALAGGSQQLGTVNGALGQTIGRLLNGRKSAIGIVGALAAGLIEGVPQIAQVLPGPVAALLPGIGGAALPVFLALSAWGVLGKMEKWVAVASAPNKPL